MKSAANLIIKPLSKELRIVKFLSKGFLFPEMHL